MSRAYIPKRLRERVAAQARHRCGYCLTAETVVGTPMEVDHIIPQSLGGLTEEDNLWLACSLCNDHKGDRIAALDPLSGEIVRLFDPRHEAWPEHFAWTGERDQGEGSDCRHNSDWSGNRRRIEPQSAIAGHRPSGVGRGGLAPSKGLKPSFL